MSNHSCALCGSTQEPRGYSHCDVCRRCVCNGPCSMLAADTSRREDEMFLCRACHKHYERYMPQIYAVMDEWRKQGLKTKTRRSSHASHQSGILEC